MRMIHRADERDCLANCLRMWYRGVRHTGVIASEGREACRVASLRDVERSNMTTYPRIAALATAAPPWRHTRESLLTFVLERMLGKDWDTRREAREQARQIERMFLASKV